MSQDYAGLLQRLGSTEVDPALIERLNQLGQNSRDQLTGLHDCRSFSYRLQSATQQAPSFTVIASSIDHMQELNLISGWVIGDIAICSFASFLEKAPFDGSFSGRTSGCTFMTFLPSREPGPIRDWLRAASEFVRKLALPGVEMFPHEHLTLSAGVFLKPQQTVSPDMCLIEAKKRLTYAQNQGGSQVSLLAADEVTVDPSGLPKIALCARCPDDAGWQEGQLEKISLHGLTFLCTRPFLVRDHVILSIGIEGDKHIELGSEVVWRKATDDGFAIGLKFDELSVGERETIEDFMTGGQ